ncbi:hypothetical protein AAF712_003832 [Marasmius tenuissimus]|uniref:Uncharacterized protein n=1 Tax=Marasmius tenuissimus TaxID=585030 RepID=A0ABR3A5J0_9AGAR
MSTTVSSLILESFPVPPSFIPPSRSRPSTAPNPPLTRPPSVPLPPIPGPSPVSETLYKGLRKNSGCSVVSRPDSIASVTSARSTGTLYTYSPNNINRSNSSRTSDGLKGYTSFLKSSESQSRTDGTVSTVSRPDDTESIYDPSEAYGGTVSSDGEEQLVETAALWKSSPKSIRSRDNRNTPLSAQLPEPPPLSHKGHATVARRRGSSNSAPSTPKNLSSIQQPLNIASGSVRSDHRTSGVSTNVHSEQELNIPTTLTYPIPPRIQLPPSLRKDKQSSHLAKLKSSPVTPSISHTPPTPNLPAFSSAPLTNEQTGYPSSSTEIPQAVPSSLSSTEVANNLPEVAFPVKNPNSRVVRKGSAPPDAPSLLHREPKSSRSRSLSVGKHLSNPRPSSSGGSGSEIALGKRPVIGPPPSSFKTSSSSFANESVGRSGSPNIEDLIESTPRPRRRSSSSALSDGYTSRSLSVSGRSNSASRSTKSRRDVSSSNTGRRGSEGSRVSQIARLERELEGFGSDDGSSSDTSLDIHTPLPHLWVRDGVLSHKSKLIPATSTGTSGEVSPTRPESSTSFGSIDSKASLLKDTRDTAVRRLRHKDRKLLGGGLGLTTGLGWSDSEDEDAPSPLTHRLSSLVVSRKSSAASLGKERQSYSSASNQLSGSKSSGDLRSAASEHPKSSTRTRLLRSQSNATSIKTSDLNEQTYMIATPDRYPVTVAPESEASTVASRPDSSRSISSNINVRRGLGSSSSRAVSIPERLPISTKSRTRSDSSLRSQAADGRLRSPSTSSSMSSVSIPPLTPEDAEDLGTPISFFTSKVDYNKTLPPLPNPSTGSIRRPSAPARLRASSIGKSMETIFPDVKSPSNTVTPPLPGSLKQLQLPRYTVAASQKSPSSPSTGSQPRTPTSPSLPSPSGLPKPRVGAGMVYRRGSNGTPSQPAATRIPAAHVSQSPMRI